MKEREIFRYFMTAWFVLVHTTWSSGTTTQQPTETAPQELTDTTPQQPTTAAAMCTCRPIDDETETVLSTQTGGSYADTATQEATSIATTSPQTSTSEMETTSCVCTTSMLTNPATSALEAISTTSNGTSGTTSVTSSSGTTPVTSSSGTMPVTSSSGTTPVTSSSGTTPVTSSSGTTPVTSSPGTTPVTSSSVTTLVTSSSGTITSERSTSKTMSTTETTSSTATEDYTSGSTTGVSQTNSDTSTANASQTTTTNTNSLSVVTSETTSTAPSTPLPSSSGTTTPSSGSSTATTTSISTTSSTNGTTISTITTNPLTVSTYTSASVFNSSASATDTSGQPTTAVTTKLSNNETSDFMTSFTQIFYTSTPGYPAVSTPASGPDNKRPLHLDNYNLTSTLRFVNISSDDYENDTTETYKTVKSELETQITSAYKVEHHLPGFLFCTVTRISTHEMSSSQQKRAVFTYDNTYVDFNMTINSSAAVLELTLFQQLIKDITLLERLSIAIGSLNVTVDSKFLLETTLSKLSGSAGPLFAPCKVFGSSVCDPCYTCTDPINLLPPYCGFKCDYNKHFTCVVDDTTSVWNTSCNCEKQYLPVARECVHQDIIIGVCTGVIAAALLALVVALVVVCMRHKPTEDTTELLPFTDIGRNTAYNGWASSDDNAKQGLISTFKGNSDELDNPKPSEVDFNTTVRASNIANGSIKQPEANVESHEEPSPIVEAESPSPPEPELMLDQLQPIAATQLVAEQPQAPSQQMMDSTFTMFEEDEDIPRDVQYSTIYKTFKPRLDAIDPHANFKILRPRLRNEASHSTRSSGEVEPDYI